MKKISAVIGFMTIGDKPIGDVPIPFLLTCRKETEGRGRPIEPGDEDLCEVVKKYDADPNADSAHYNSYTNGIRNVEAHLTMERLVDYEPKYKRQSLQFMEDYPDAPVMPPTPEKVLMDREDLKNRVNKGEQEDEGYEKKLEGQTMEFYTRQEGGVYRGASQMYLNMKSMGTLPKWRK